MNTISSFLFKSWTRCALTLVALGAVLCAVQQGISQRHTPAAIAPITSPAPLTETRALPDPAAEAELPQGATPVAATPRESSPVSPAPVSAPAKEPVAVSTRSGPTVPPPLARAVPAAPGVTPFGVDSSGNIKTAMLNPPLAFTVDPKNLTPAQQTALASIQNQFLQAIGDANQNPTDPDYADRWVAAQALADQRYKAYFGWQSFEQMQLQRDMHSYTAIQVP